MVEENVADNSKRRELWGFFFLTVIFAPVLAVAIVGGYGFLVWMYQLVQGPPAY
ncbi:MAG: periplasmic nitrate reductase, NapE protein [Proteobacteria bacterium]|nr:periplasmic nitrate reductase, NapE protein [Pseudomonadota bacterium]MCH8999298.1 periplasmic nitrate reductase, NapE protein [Pseudomonadota bacterium]